MGLTPAAGLPGATRAGGIDPTLIFHYTHDAARITHSTAGMRDVGITEVRPAASIVVEWLTRSAGGRHSQQTLGLASIDGHYRLRGDYHAPREG
jgi:hypothetical protein